MKSVCKKANISLFSAIEKLINLFRMKNSTHEKYTTTDNAISSSIYFTSIYLENEKMKWNLFAFFRLNFVGLQFLKYF